MDRIIVSAILLVVTIIIWLILRVMIKRWEKFLADESHILQICGLAVIVIVGIVVQALVWVGADSRDNLIAIIGIVLSAGLGIATTPFITNAIAGLMLVSSSNVRPGDYVETGEHFGRVTRRRLFNLQIQTEDRDLKTLPNMFVMSNPLKIVKPSGTIISCTVSLGYNVHRSKVERALLMAAIANGLEEPFVQVTDLGDHSITYRVAGLLTDVTFLITKRSNLRKYVLDALHSEHIEIVSPWFMNRRDIANEEKQIPPIQKAPTEESDMNQQAPEKLFFDDADLAATIERLTDRRNQLMEEIKAIKAEDATDPAMQFDRKARLQKKERYLDILASMLEKAQAELDDGD